MRLTLRTLCLTLLAVCCLMPPLAGAAEQIKDITAEIYFSPNGGTTDAIVRLIGQEPQTILMQAYSFTSAPIAKALVDAHKRGVKVVAILDKSQRTEKYSGADFLIRAGIPTVIDAQHAIAHNKIFLWLGLQKTGIGSFNFTKSAEERNAENFMILSSPQVMNLYLANFKAHYEHSEAYAGR